MPIYLVQHGDRTGLVRAATQAQARSHAARSLIKVAVAGPDDLYELGRAGVAIEEADKSDPQHQIGETQPEVTQ